MPTIRRSQGIRLLFPRALSPLLLWRVARERFRAVKISGMPPLNGALCVLSINNVLVPQRLVENLRGASEKCMHMTRMRRATRTGPSSMSSSENLHAVFLQSLAVDMRCSEFFRVRNRRWHRHVLLERVAARFLRLRR